MMPSSVNFRMRRQMTERVGAIRARSLSRLVPGARVAAGVRLGRAVEVIIEPGGQLILGQDCFISAGVVLHVGSIATLELGHGVFVGHGTVIMAKRSVTVGSRSALAEGVSIRDHDHVLGLSPDVGGLEVSPVNIGEGVWLASKVTVTRGCTIGDLAAVGAGAVVTRDLAPRVVAVGVPARVIRTA